MTMHRPTVMVSSTCTDLSEIRSAVKDFLETHLGYRVLLSDQISFPTHPQSTTIETCLRAVNEDADVLVLIIGHRYGSIDESTGKSITHLEYLEAVSRNLPIFVFIQDEVSHLLPTWETNPDADFSLSVEDPKIFEFISEIRRARTWTHNFTDAAKIVDCLRSQFSYLMHVGLQASNPIRAGSSTIEGVQQFLDAVEANDLYKRWVFRINWPLADISAKVDAYSDETDWTRLLGVLMPSAIGRHEISLVFKALARLVSNNINPPSKLSGAILFADASKTALDVAQHHLGSHHYEQREREEQCNSTDDLGEPKGIMLPSKYLGSPQNHNNYEEAQRVIAQFASYICKSVLCSSYQISISSALLLARGSESGNDLAMCCTARDTNKELLAEVAEIPVVMQVPGSGKQWYGQPSRRPTSEHRSHWEYHSKALANNSNKALIVHYHPVELSELYDTLKRRFTSGIPQSIWDEAEEVSMSTNVPLKVYRNYLSVSAREPEFGAFLARTAITHPEAQTPKVIVWKPRHGIWLLTNPLYSEEQWKPVLEEIDFLAKELVDRLVAASSVGARQ